MRDGSTQKLERDDPGSGLERFLEGYRARMVVVSGHEAGADFVLDRGLLTIGRGPGVDVAFDNPAMSRQHAAIEFNGEGFRIRDLGSTNGLKVNGAPVQVAELFHGDRVEMGSQVFQLVIEEQEVLPEVYELTPEV